MKYKNFLLTIFLALTLSLFSCRDYHLSYDERSMLSSKPTVKRGYTNHLALTPIPKKVGESIKRLYIHDIHVNPDNYMVYEIEKIGADKYNTHIQVCTDLYSKRWSHLIFKSRPEKETIAILNGWHKYIQDR